MTPAPPQPLFLETVRWSRQRYHLLELHDRRMQRTLNEAFGITHGHPLAHLLPEAPPAQMRHTTVKCRVTYGGCGIQKIDFEPYAPRPINSLRIVDGGNIDYHLKYADRNALDRLTAMSDGADAVIIMKNRLVTDATYANLVFIAGTRLLTPATPLLRGVMVSHLITTGQVTALPLTLTDISPGNRLGITHVMLVNAMLPPGSMPPVDINNIII